MAEITWNISALDVKPQYGEYQDCVITVHWQCNAIQDGYSASVYSTCSFAQPSKQVFIPYQDLTKQTVLEWIWANGVDKDATEAVVQKQIDNQLNPPVIQPALPWSN